MKVLYTVPYPNTGTIIDVIRDIIQIKIALADGNSGHPLLNDEYMVVGIQVGLWESIICVLHGVRHELKLGG